MSIFISQARAARILDVTEARFKKLLSDGLVQPVAEGDRRRLLFRLQDIEALRVSDPLVLMASPNKVSKVGSFCEKKKEGA